MIREWPDFARPAGNVGQGLARSPKCVVTITKLFRIEHVSLPLKPKLIMPLGIMAAMFGQVKGPVEPVNVGVKCPLKAHS